MTPEERQEIVNLVVEEIYLKLPELIGNLITNHISQIRINKDFYDRYPDLKDHRQLVASIVERIEGEDPTRDYKQIIESAVPHIRKAIKETRGLNMSSLTKPTRDLSNGEL